nr:hypothetical protein [Gemmatimonadaceae bacterium]
CGTNSETLRDIIQSKLFGSWENVTQGKPMEGGMVPPGDIIGSVRRPHGLPGSLETVWVQHVSGGRSIIGLKMYEQGRKSFEGTAKHLIWDDEEPDEGIYTEQLFRTATTNGIVMVTFTPLQGMSDVVKGFVQPDPAAAEFKRMINAGWDDVPHLAEHVKRHLLATTPPFQRDARTKGLPQLGAGAIYQIPESQIVVPDFAIPRHFRRCFGLDAGGGAKPTAVAWMAEDPDTNTCYIYSVYKRDSPEIALHVAAIKARGEWVPGAGDAAALVMTAHDVEQLVSKYRQAGLDLVLADKAVEAGIQDVWELMTAGQFKVFASCSPWLEEFRMYHRDEKGRIVKKDDHLLDACVRGDTPVITDQGTVPIASLVGQTGRVLTRGGAWARFCGARKTMTQVPVVRLAFDDGSEVVCTPDHLFLTPDGWRRADAMAGVACYDGVAQRIHWTQCLLDLLSPLRRFKVAAITSAASITNATEIACTAWSGWRRMARSLAGSMSTTRTTTVPTTPWTTWNFSRGMFICPITSAGTSGPCPPPPSMLRANGTSPTKAARGIASTTRRIAIYCTSAVRSSVDIAGETSRRWIRASTASALTPAGPPRVVRLVWTMSNVCASSAASLLWRTATHGNAPARAAVVRHCRTVVPAGRADVYCLTVPGTSSFCLGNGSVVHNTRYAVRTGRKRARTPNHEQDKARAATSAGSRPKTWMGRT